MNLETIKYNDYIQTIPKAGRCILGQQTNDKILVYQAYNNAIADYALQYQFFGGNGFSYSRMSWIKPNFLWMMYRCGWASKVNQERVLGIWIKKTDFDLILSHSVFSSFDSSIYHSHEDWKQALEMKPVRLQWDPDHDIHGEKQDRKAIQLGIKGDLLQKYGKEMPCSIIDITAFVKDQKDIIESKKVDQLEVPKETVYIPENAQIRKQIGLI